MTKIMINKPLRAYNTRRQLIFLILPDGEVVWVFLFQRLKHEIHGIFEFLIVFSDLRGVDELDQRGKILFLDRGLIVDVADERRVKEGLCFFPEVISGFAVSLCVGDKRRDQLQNVLFGMNVREGIVAHTFFEVDGVEDFDAVAPAPQEISAFHDDAALRVRNNEARRIIFGIALHQVRLDEKPRLAGTGATDYQHVFVPGRLGVLRSAVHGKPFRLRENA